MRPWWRPVAVALLTAACASPVVNVDGGGDASGLTAAPDAGTATGGDPGDGAAERPGGDGAADGGPARIEWAVPPDGAEPVTLERLIDGDSMELGLDGDVVEARLLGGNAPELRTVAGTASCPGDAARRAMADLLDRGELFAVVGDTDRFGRLLVDLYVGDADVNRSLVAGGWALGLWSADDQALVRLMQEAASDGLGIWGDGPCGPPSAPIGIAGVQVDPPGPDEERLDQEWVEIVNDGPDPVDLDGWSIADETTSNRFPLPGRTLAPGDVLRIVTGAGPDGPGLFHLAHDGPVWSNRGETILVVDPEGRIAAYRFVS